MGLPPVGPGSPNLNDLFRLGGIPTPGGERIPASSITAVNEDQIASLLQLLATPDFSQLLSSIEQRLPAANPTLTQQLLQAASSATAAGDVPLALVKVRELLTLNPQLAETVPNEPALQPIQREVVNLVRQLTLEARTLAQDTMATAAQAIESGGAQKLPTSDADLHTVLALASRFVDSGRLTDYLMATELGRVVIARYASLSVLAAPKAASPTLIELLARPEIATLISNIGQRLLAQSPALMEELLHTANTLAIAIDLPRALAKMPEIGQLIPTLQRLLLPPQNPALTDELLHAAIAAVNAGDMPRVLAKVKELVILNPRQAETIAANPSLRAIQPEVNNLIRQLTSQARIQAEEKVAAAAQAIVTGGLKKLEGAEVDPRTILSLATYLLESGRLPDYLLAMELAQVVIARYETVRGRKAPRPVRVGRPRPEPIRARFERWWLRAPLLVLLLSWLALGLAFGIGALVMRKLWPDSFDPSIATLAFDVWGIGFLAIIGFGFYMRIRNVRFR